MQRYTQLAYFFHQCGTSHFSREGRIAYFIARHVGVERPFSSFISSCVFYSAANFDR